MAVQTHRKSAGYLTGRERDATGMQDIEVHLRDQHNVVSGKESSCTVEHCCGWRIAALQDVELP